jgi:hypothetical protein
MHPSGQTKPQLEHPVQLSGFNIYEKAYPFVLTSFDNLSTSKGHAFTHTSQPLQRSVSTIIAPFVLAILYYFQNYLQSERFAPVKTVGKIRF